MEKTYISPDIIVVEMENNLMAENVISTTDVTNAAGDSKNKTEGPEIGDNNGKGGTSGVPQFSKDNGFDPWSSWDD